jgi:hypothetical protein
MGEEIFMGRYSLLEEEEGRKRRRERKEVAEYEVHNKADSGTRFGIVADGPRK